MRHLFLILSLCFLAACADDRADIEKARFLLAKGSTADVAEAVGLLTPMLTSTTGVRNLEVVGLYAGAKMQQAGIDSIRIIAALVHGDGEDTVAKLRSAFAPMNDLEADVVKAALADAVAKLTDAKGSANFAAADAQTQNGLEYQLGLAYFFDALRLALKTSGLLSISTTETFDVAACQGSLASEFESVSSNLTDSSTELSASGLDSQNPIVEFVDTMASDIGGASADLTSICDYINSQSTVQ